MRVGVRSGDLRPATVQIEFDSDAGDATLAVDVQEIRRVFLNLVHNAIQACGDRGKVVVSSSLLPEWVEFRVEDDGPGVAEDVRARLFEPYFTTKTSGTGLGLAICRNIVEAHEGDILLESSAPQRTVFLLRLPRSTAAPG